MERRNLRAALETFLSMYGRSERASDEVVFVDKSVERSLRDWWIYRFQGLNPIIVRIVMTGRGEIRTGQEDILKSGFFLLERYDAEGNTRFPQLIVPKVGPPRLRHDRSIPAISYSRFHPAPDSIIDQIIDDLRIRWIIEVWGR